MLVVVEGGTTCDIRKGSKIRKILQLLKNNNRVPNLFRNITRLKPWVMHENKLKICKIDVHTSDVQYVILEWYSRCQGYSSQNFQHRWLCNGMFAASALFHKQTISLNCRYQCSMICWVLWFAYACLPECSKKGCKRFTL